MRKPRNLFVCVSKEREDGERGEREGEGKQALSLSSGTNRLHNSLAEQAGRLTVVELREPRNLCACVSEDLGHGEGVIGVPSKLRVIRRSVDLTRMFPTLDLSIEEKAARR